MYNIFFTCLQFGNKQFYMRPNTIKNKTFIGRLKFNLTT